MQCTNEGKACDMTAKPANGLDQGKPIFERDTFALKFKVIQFITIWKLVLN